MMNKDDHDHGVNAGGRRPDKRPSNWPRLIIAALVVTNLIAAAVAVLEWPRGRIAPDRLGLVRYHRQMRCDLPLSAAQGVKTITFHNTFIRNVNNDCKFDFVDALVAGIHLRFLVLDPLSEATDMRVHEFLPGTYSPGEYRHRIRDYVDALLWVANRARSRKPALNIDEALQVHVYHDLPGMPIYIVQRGNPDDDVIYQGLFLVYRGGSDELPSGEFARPPQGGKDAILFDEMRRYVELKWNQSTPLSLSELRACLGSNPADDRWYECIHDSSNYADPKRPSAPSGNTAAITPR
jgi:hypothetical protein